MRTAIATILSLVVLAHAADGHVHGCHTRDCDKRIHRKRIRHWIAAHVWVYRWHHLSEAQRGWARCIAGYETRGTPWAHKAQVATGNGYYGSTQWLPATWHMAGGSGLPTEHTLDEQLVRTVWWAHRAGSSQWSTSRFCGGVPA